MSQVQIATVLTLVQTCGGGGYEPEPATSTGISCEDYELMLNIEIEFAEECEVDADCDQVLSGTGEEDCDTDDLIVTADYDPSWFYDTLEEAEGVGCIIELNTVSTCNPTAEPACVWTKCRWQ